MATTSHVLVLTADRTDNRADPPTTPRGLSTVAPRPSRLVDQIVRTTGRRRHLSAPELEDFSSFVRLRLIENDYAILRKFQNRSTLWTYLSAVIERLSLDYCAEKWGRWRPSAMAERLGPAAVVLERLVSRDWHTVEEALEILSNHDFGLDEADLLKIWEQLPLRVRTTDVGEEAARLTATQL